MIDFGYKRQPSGTVNLDNVDLSLYRRIAKAEPDIQICMACGSCSATCTAGPFNGMSLRKVILYLQRGKEKEAAALLKRCMLCGKCTMVCPRGINTRHLILSICRFYTAEEAGQ